MFKIGEFARVADVSVHLLRHYDSIALFVPHTIDKQTGYRFYSVEQLPRLHRIIALRELGLTLEQIANMLDDNISDCEIQGMLRLKQQQVEQLIETENARLGRIAARLNQLQTDNQSHAYEIVVKPVPEIFFLSTGHQAISDSDAVDILIETRQQLKQFDVGQVDYSLAIVHDSQTEEGLHNIEIGYPLKQALPQNITLESGITLTTRKLKAVDTMATAMHHGARIDNGQIYQAIFTWMEANQYQFLDGHQPREQYYLAAYTDDEPNTIVEVQVPIIKQNLA